MDRPLARRCEMEPIHANHPTPPPLPLTRNAGPLKAIGAAARVRSDLITGQLSFYKVIK